MVKQELRAVMIRFGDRQEDLAAALGIAPATLSKKMNGESVFTQPEIEIIALRYKLTAEDIQRIFFCSDGKLNINKVTKKATKGATNT